MIVDTLTSPIILFFVLGFFAALIKSDLSIPEAFGKAMSIYLMAAIGLKGGIEVAEAGFSVQLAWAALAGLGLSFLLPVPAYFLLVRFGGLKPVDAGAVAAHYGSVSVVTFVTAQEILTGRGLEPAGYMVAIMALMETPAIISGLLLLQGKKAPTPGVPKQSTTKLLHEVFSNGSVILLVGAFLIGMVAGKDGFAPVKPLFDTGFRGVLCLFLLDMGLVAARRLIQSRKLTLPLIVLAIAMPVMNGMIGAALGVAIGLDPGSAAILAVLAASASYIAVPAAMRLAVPEADPGVYLSMSLGITFPFNIIFGITIYAAMVQMML
ncbi:MAG: sodium-dependent bicarbonate transport family permease [Sphingomonadales bacterium]|nr:sodium-dependent bicarbonate transport family permease [Sphingomonadales bacterium]